VFQQLGGLAQATGRVERAEGIVRGSQPLPGIGQVPPFGGGHVAHPIATVNDDLT